MKACRNPSCHRLPRARGFTLMELMLAITVAALVLGFGVPTFRDFIRNSRITGVANEFLAATYLARGEAIKRRATTVLCLTSNPDDAQPTCDGDGTQGWIVFVDDADPTVIEVNDRNGVVDDGEAVLMRHSALDEAVRTSSIPNGNDAYVSFAPNGMLRQLDDLVAMSAFVLCDERGNTVIAGDDDSAARGIEISPIGRPRVTRSQTEIESDTFGGCP